MDPYFSFRCASGICPSRQLTTVLEKYKYSEGVVSECCLMERIPVLLY